MIRVRLLLRRDRTLRDRLHRDRLWFGVTSGIGRRRFLQSQWLLQRHLNRCSYAQEKIVRTGEQHERCHETGRAADTRADDRVFGFRAEDRRGCRAAKGRYSDAPGREVGGDFRLRLPNGVADERAHTSSGGGQNHESDRPLLARILQRIAFVALQCYRSGDRSDVTVGESDRYGLKMKFRTASSLLELVDLPLHKCARGNHHLIAGSDWRGDLGINVVAAAHGSALNVMCEHQRNAGSGGKRYGGRFWQRLSLRAGLRVRR